MRFTQRFDSYVCAGDVITCEVGALTVSARIVTDDCTDPPDQRQDGFWPSLYANDPGFIGPGNGFRDRFAKARAEAEAIMAGLRAGDWFYCGVVLSVSAGDVRLCEHAASLWGIEANHPGSDNGYLGDVADELLPEAVAAGLAALARLTDAARRAVPNVRIVVFGGVVQDVIVTGGAADIVIDDRDNAP